MSSLATDAVLVQSLLTAGTDDLYPVFYYININHRRTQDFTMEGVTWCGARPGSLGDGRTPVESRGKAPVRGLEDFVPQ